MNGEDDFYFHPPGWNCEAKKTTIAGFTGRIHVVANSVSSPFTNDTISFPPSLDSPYTRSTKEIGTCRGETSAEEKTFRGTQTHTNPDSTSRGFSVHRRSGFPSDAGRKTKKLPPTGSACLRFFFSSSSCEERTALGKQCSERPDDGKTRITALTSPTV